jgi:hypothetical protein
MAGDYQLWIDDSGGPPPPPDQQPRGPRWSRWIALVAGFAALLALIAVQHFTGSDIDRSAPTPGPSVTQPPDTSRSDAPSTPPTTSPTQSPTRTGTPSLTAPPPTAPVTATTSGDLSLPGQRWELVGFQWSGALGGGSAVVRYRPDTGEIVTTPTPPLVSPGPFSFDDTACAAIDRPTDFVDGYVIPDGRPAEIAGGILSQAGVVVPAPQLDRVWVAAPDGDAVDLIPVDSTGRSTRPIIEPPQSLVVQGGWNLTSDGYGAVLAHAVGGVYDLRPGEIQLVTHGIVLAAGPTGYLVYECDEAARCSTAIVDRALKTRIKLVGYEPSDAAPAEQIQGVLSPNGRYAAVLDYSQGARLIIVDLRTGRWTPVGDTVNSRAPRSGDASSVVTFTPDSGTLLMAAAGGVDAVNPSTGEVLGRLPLPPLAAIAIRPVG